VFLGLVFVGRVASYEAERFDVPVGVLLLLSFFFAPWRLGVMIGGHGSASVWCVSDRGATELTTKT